MTEDMTLAEFVEAKRALEKEIGPKSEVYVTVGRRGEEMLAAAVYPDGIGRDRDVGRITADTYRDLLSAVRARWEERSAEFAAETVKKIALAIIRLTHEQGACTDAALRQEFDAETVKRYGAAAVERADEMSDRRPFRIVELAGANAA